MKYFFSVSHPYHKRKRYLGKKDIVIQPILFSYIILRSKLDLSNFQSLPGINYKFILIYPQFLTQFVILTPLQTKTAVEIFHKGA